MGKVQPEHENMTEDCHMWKRIQWFQENEQGVVWGEEGKKKENPKQYMCKKQIKDKKKKENPNKTAILKF